MSGIDWTKFPHGSLLVVTWHDVQSSIDGGPQDAALFGRQTTGFFQCVVNEHGCPEYVVFSMDRALDGDDSDMGWHAIPTALICDAQVAGVLVQEKPS